MNSTDSTMDNESKVAHILSILIIFGTLSTIAVLMRIYTRTIVLNAYHLDDILITFSQVLTIGTAIAMGLEVKYGMGQHVWMVPPSNTLPYMKSFYASILCYNSGITLVRLSILLQIRRIFATRNIQIVTLIGLVFVGCWGTGTFLWSIFVCDPVASFWDKSLNGKCSDLITVWYIRTIGNIVSDFAIFIIPLPVLYTLNLPKRRKFILYAIFGLGFFACLVSLIRIHTLKAASSLKDSTWNNAEAATWTFLEISTATLTACLPTLRPLVMRIMPQFLGSSLLSSDNISKSRNPPLRENAKSCEIKETVVVEIFH